MREIKDITLNEEFQDVILNEINKIVKTASKAQLKKAQKRYYIHGDKDAFGKKVLLLQSTINNLLGNGFSNYTRGIEAFSYLDDEELEELGDDICTEFNYKVYIDVDTDVDTFYSDLKAPFFADNEFIISHLVTERVKEEIALRFPEGTKTKTKTKITTKIFNQKVHMLDSEQVQELFQITGKPFSSEEYPEYNIYLDKVQGILDGGAIIDEDSYYKGTYEAQSVGAGSGYYLKCPYLVMLTCIETEDRNLNISLGNLVETPNGVRKVKTLNNLNKVKFLKAAKEMISQMPELFL